MARIIVTQAELEKISQSMRDVLEDTHSDYADLLKRIMNDCEHDLAVVRAFADSNTGLSLEDFTHLLGLDRVVIERWISDELLHPFLLNYQDQFHLRQLSDLRFVQRWYAAGMATEAIRIELNKQRLDSEISRLQLKNSLNAIIERTRKFPDLYEKIRSFRIED